MIASFWSDKTSSISIAIVLFFGGFIVVQGGSSYSAFGFVCNSFQKLFYAYSLVAALNCQILPDSRLQLASTYLFFTYYYSVWHLHNLSFAYFLANRFIRIVYLCAKTQFSSLFQ